VFLKLPKNNLL